MFCSDYWSTPLTLNLLTTTIVAPPSNASKWQLGFNSAFKGLIKQLPVGGTLLVGHLNEALRYKTECHSSIPGVVIGLFHWHNPSGCTMDLVSTQPLTEMSYWRVKAASALAWHPYYPHVPNVSKSGRLNVHRECFTFTSFSEYDPVADDAYRLCNPTSGTIWWASQRVGVTWIGANLHNKTRVTGGEVTECAGPGVNN